MLKVKNVTIGEPRYDSGYQCAVTFQVGSEIYNAVKVDLSPAATREVIELAVRRATEALTIEPEGLVIAGEKPAEDAPVADVAEADEAPGIALPRVEEAV